MNGERRASLPFLACELYLERKVTNTPGIPTECWVLHKRFYVHYAAFWNFSSKIAEMSSVLLTTVSLAHMGGVQKIFA